MLYSIFMSTTRISPSQQDIVKLQIYTPIQNYLRHNLLRCLCSDDLEVASSLLTHTKYCVTVSDEAHNMKNLLLVTARSRSSLSLNTQTNNNKLTHILLTIYSLLTAQRNGLH